MLVNRVKHNGLNEKTIETNMLRLKQTHVHTNIRIHARTVDFEVFGRASCVSRARIKCTQVHRVTCVHTISSVSVPAHTLPILLAKCILPVACCIATSSVIYFLKKTKRRLTIFGQFVWLKTPTSLHTKTLRSLLLSNSHCNS